jgi:hypothetical protein
MASFLGQTVCESQAVSKSPLPGSLLPSHPPWMPEAPLAVRGPTLERPIPGPYRLLWASFAEEGPPTSTRDTHRKMGKATALLVGGITL